MRGVSICLVFSHTAAGKGRNAQPWGVGARPAEERAKERAESGECWNS